MTRMPSSASSQALTRECSSFQAYAPVYGVRNG